MATNAENEILEYLKTKNGTSTLGQIIRHLKLTKHEINQHLYKLKSKGKVLKVQKQNPPVWKLITHFTKKTKLSQIESSGKAETKRGKGSNQANDSSERKVAGPSIMPRMGETVHWPSQGGRGGQANRNRGRGGRRRGRVRHRGGGVNRGGFQSRKGTWTDGSESNRNYNQIFTPSATAEKTEEILRLLVFKEDPVSVEEIQRNMGSYATMDDINNSLTTLIHEKKVVRMPNNTFAPNVVKSVRSEPVAMSMMNDDPAVLDLKAEGAGSGEGSSSLGFYPQMDTDEIQVDGQFSDEDDYDDDDDDDFGMEIKSDDGWGVYPYYMETQSHPDDFKTEDGFIDKEDVPIKQENEAKYGEGIVSGTLLADSSYPERIKQEFIGDQDYQRETNVDSFKQESSMDYKEVSGSEAIEDSYQKSSSFKPSDSDQNVSCKADTSEHNLTDKVLLAFIEMPIQSCKQFILEKKVKCESSELGKILNQLKSDKLVGLTSDLWSLTKNGEDYLKMKGLWTKCEASVGRGRGRMLELKGAGPPQSPLKLITSNTVFSTGVEKSPVPALSYQPEKEKNFQIFPTPSNMSAIPSLMNVNTTNLNSNQTLKTTSNNVPFSNPMVSMQSGGSYASLSNVTSTSNQPITGGSQSVDSNIFENRMIGVSQMPTHPPIIMGRGRGLLTKVPMSTPQRSNVTEEKPFKKPPTPAELARMESEGRSDPKNQLCSNSVPHSLSSSNLHYSPSHMSGPSSLMPAHSSPELLHSQSSSPMIPSPLLTSFSPMLPAEPSSLKSSASSSLLSSNLNDNLKISTESFSAVNKNPISALMEYAQSRHQQAKIEVISQRGPSHKPTFIIAAIIGQRIFPGVKSGSKKDGRTEAADLALRILLSEGQYNINQEPSKSGNAASSSNTCMTHFDKMAALSHQAFNQLIASIPEKFAGRKVIAALILKRNQTDTGTVISVGSGNRCITGEQLSLEGNTVNDSHAEIITRRGFIRFLYKQLETYTINQPHEFFEKGLSGKLRIKSNFTFHLYISTAPCGDGALFSPRDAASNKGPVEDIENHQHNPTFTSNVQGVLRTKMEGGEGTIPIESDFTVQTWDGIVRGERLRTMSCTDKICRWNVVGMQGALLSHLIEPVYLNSLTLGYLYDHGHLARAVCCRVGKGEPDINSLLPSGYQLNHPWLGRMTACEPQRETQKTKALSINWCLGDERPEVIDGTTGRCYTGVERTFFSRLCKKDLYTSFRSVCTKFGLSDLLSAKTYLDAKKMATDFQTAKNIMLKRLKDNGFSIWVSKPMEEEMFDHK